MPYQRSWVGLSLLLAVTIFAFWPSYFSVIKTSSWQHHLHGIAGTSWMLLLIVQTRLIDQRAFRLHRTLGLAMFAVVPMFTLGGWLVSQQMIARGDDFGLLLGDRLALVDLVGPPAFAFFVHQALIHRRNPALHGGWLLVTALLLIEAAFTRIFGPLFMQLGLDFLSAFALAFDVAIVTAMVVAAALWRWQPRHPAPFVTALAVVAFQGAAFHLAPALPVWLALCRSIAALPAWQPAGIGFAIGLLAVVHGWRNPAQRLKPPAALSNPV